MSVLARVRGALEEKTADSVILFAGGLGLEIQVPLSTMNALPATGEEATLRTYLHIREGAIGLYGFCTAAEQRMFELLLTVTGVGPRAALNCLSMLSVDQLGTAIASGDGDSLRRVPLIGRKTADRILLELKARVQNFAGDAPHPLAPVSDETIEALMFYGYSATEAAAAIATLPRDQELSVEDRTMLALRYFAPQAEQRGRRS